MTARRSGHDALGVTGTFRRGVIPRNRDDVGDGDSIGDGDWDGDGDGEDAGDAEDGDGG